MSVDAAKRMPRQAWCNVSCGDAHEWNRTELRRGPSRARGAKSRKLANRTACCALRKDVRHLRPTGVRQVRQDAGNRRRRGRSRLRALRLLALLQRRVPPPPPLACPAPHARPAELAKREVTYHSTSDVRRRHGRRLLSPSHRQRAGSAAGLRRGADVSGRLPRLLATDGGGLCARARDGERPRRLALARPPTSHARSRWTRSA